MDGATRPRCPHTVAPARLNCYSVPRASVSAPSHLGKSDVDEHLHSISQGHGIVLSLSPLGLIFAFWFRIREAVVLELKARDDVINVRQPEGIQCAASSFLENIISRGAVMHLVNCV